MSSHNKPGHGSWLNRASQRFDQFLMRSVPVWVLAVCLLLAGFGTIIFGWAVKHYVDGRRPLGIFGETADIIASFPSLVGQSVREILFSPQELSSDLYPGEAGLSLHLERFSDDGYLLLSGYDSELGIASVKLIRLSDGVTLHRWIPSVQAINALARYDSEFGRPYVQNTFRAIHPLLRPDGGIILNDTGPLVKLDACSKVEWVLSGVFHHSIEAGPDGAIWAAATKVPSALNPNVFPLLYDDAIARISPAGKLLEMKSVAGLLDRQGYRALVLGAGQYEHDALHLNQIDVAKSSSPFWQKGDVLVSLRYKSAVFLYRPDEDRIIWLKTGPWLNQHAAKFAGDSAISVFGNDVVRMANRPRAPVFPDGHSTVYLYDLGSGAISKPFDRIMAQLNVRAESEGLSEMLANGDVFVEDSMSGRLFRASADSVRWSYVNRPKADDRIGVLNWSRYLTPAQVRDVLPKLRCR
jgi:hypothetical protein